MLWQPCSLYMHLIPDERFKYRISGLVGAQGNRSLRLSLMFHPVVVMDVACAILIIISILTKQQQPRLGPPPSGWWRMADDLCVTG